MGQLKRDFINLKSMKAVSNMLIVGLVFFLINSGKAQSFAFESPVFNIPQKDTFNAVKIQRSEAALRFSPQWHHEKMDFQINQLPLFCKMEELLFRSSGINLRINLGTNDQVRKLEGKY